MSIPADNRQIKLLRLFGLPVANIAGDSARQQIHLIWAEPANRDRWNKYVYLTQDLDSTSAELKPFDLDALNNVILPNGWTAATAERQHREKIAQQILKVQSLYDVPAPIVQFRNQVFSFTGRFAYGRRSRCERAVVERGGLMLDSDWITHVVDYLVVGAKGSEQWKYNDYGAKIEAAVVERSIHSRPAIIAEAHWREFLSAEQAG